MAYEQLFKRLGIGPAQVEDYIRQEWRLLASLYFAAREPMPSADRLCRLAYQLAIDARQPIIGRLLVFEAKETESGWSIRQHDCVASQVIGLPATGHAITEISPWVPQILR
jgi:hypothetical protein